MKKEQQVTTATEAPKSHTVRVYSSTKTRLEKLVRDKAAKEDRDITEIELVDRYVNIGLTRDERKLKLA